MDFEGTAFSRELDAEAVAHAAVLVSLLATASVEQSTGCDRLPKFAYRLTRDPRCSTELRELAHALPAHYAAAHGWFSPRLEAALRRAVHDGLVEVRSGRVTPGPRHKEMLDELALERSDLAALARASGRLSVSV